MVRNEPRFIDSRTRVLSREAQQIFVAYMNGEILLNYFMASCSFIMMALIPKAGETTGVQTR